MDYLGNVVYPSQNRLQLLKDKIGDRRNSWSDLFAKIVPQMISTFHLSFFLNRAVFEGFRMYFQDHLGFERQVDLGIGLFERVVRGLVGSGEREDLGIGRALGIVRGSYIGSDFEDRFFVMKSYIF